MLGFFELGSSSVQPSSPRTSRPCSRDMRSSEMVKVSDRPAREKPGSPRRNTTSSRSSSTCDDDGRTGTSALHKTTSVVWRRDDSEVLTSGSPLTVDVFTTPQGIAWCAYAEIEIHGG